jgi:hypothetical protein
MSQVQGTFGLLYFTMLRSVLAWSRFETYEPFISLIFQFFFRAAVNRGYWISGYGGTTVIRNFTNNYRHVRADIRASIKLVAVLTRHIISIRTHKHNSNRQLYRTPQALMASRQTIITTTYKHTRVSQFTQSYFNYAVMTEHFKLFTVLSLMRLFQSVWFNQNAQSN